MVNSNFSIDWTWPGKPGYVSHLKRPVYSKFSMRSIVTLAFALLTSNCALGQGLAREPSVLEAVPVTGQLAELDLGPVVYRLNPDDSGVQTKYGWFCLPTGKRYFPSDQPAISRASLDQAMRAALEPLNYKLRSRVGSVFSNDRPSRLYLGGTVTAIRANVCHPYTGTASLTAGNPSLAKGNVFIEVSWELFDNAENRVIFAATVQGTFETAETIDGGLPAILMRAATNNISKLAALPEFRQSVMSVSPQLTPNRAFNEL